MVPNFLIIYLLVCFRLEDIAIEKTELNAQVNALTRQAASDAEKIENLAIQGDIWKSKFLATR